MCTALVKRIICRRRGHLAGVHCEQAPDTSVNVIHSEQINSALSRNLGKRYMRLFFRETFPLPLFTFEKDARMHGSERRFLSRDAHGLVVDLFFRNDRNT